MAPHWSRPGCCSGIIQLASVVGGLATAVGGEMAGLRRLLISGLVLLSAASALGAAAPSTELLMAARTLEGVGFLLAVVVAPALIRKVAPPQRLNVALASWATFQGTATLIGLSAGALFLQAAGWREWWLVMAVLTLLPVPLLLRRVPKDVPLPTPGSAPRSAGWAAPLPPAGPGSSAWSSPATPRSGWRCSASCRRSTGQPGSTVRGRASSAPSWAG